MAKGKREGKTTQKTMVETAIKEKGWDAGPQELQTVIKEKFSTELPNNVISNYKSILKRANGKGGSSAGGGAKRGRKSGPAFSDFEEVRGLVNRLGADQVKKLIDMAEMFS